MLIRNILKWIHMHTCWNMDLIDEFSALFRNTFVITSMYNAPFLGSLPAGSWGIVECPMRMSWMRPIAGLGLESGKTGGSLESRQAWTRKIFGRALTSSWSLNLYTMSMYKSTSFRSFITIESAALPPWLIRAIKHAPQSSIFAIFRKSSSVSANC